jgi:hypothetical protein
MTEEEKPKDYTNLEIDMDLAADFALENAQFGFAISPMSIWEAYAPAYNPKTGGAYLRLTEAGRKYKDDIYMLAKSQTRRRDSRAYNWGCQQRFCSVWVILRAGHKKCENMDGDNCHKLILDSFVTAGLIPDDKHTRDNRDIYGDFEKAGWPDSMAFAVLIRWGKPINRQGKML